jgi:hypothetical protein
VFLFAFLGSWVQDNEITFIFSNTGWNEIHPVYTVAIWYFLIG